MKTGSQVGPFPPDNANAGIRADWIPVDNIISRGPYFPTQEGGHELGLLHASGYTTEVDECSDDLPLGIENQLNTDCVSLYGDDTVMDGVPTLLYEMSGCSRDIAS